MLIFRDPSAQPAAEPPRKPTVPIWSRRPENFSGEELIAEARVRADFIESKDALTASWLRAIIDQLDAQLSMSVTLAKRLEFVQREQSEDRQITIGELRRRLMDADEDDLVSFDAIRGLQLDRSLERRIQQKLAGPGTLQDRLDRFIENIEDDI